MLALHCLPALGPSYISMFSIVPSNASAETSAATTSGGGVEQPRGTVPIEEIKPVVPQPGPAAQVMALLRYMAGTEVHSYAFSVAANAILSLFPFIVLLLTICRRVFHSRAMEEIVGDLMRGFL